MRKLTMTLLLVAGVAACSDIPIGPVDHSCPNNPGYSSGSGCGHAGH
jgi:hypothetical protein